MHSYKKVFFLTAGISLAAHVAVLAMPVFFRSQANIRKEVSFVTVDLRKSPSTATHIPELQDEGRRVSDATKHRGNSEGAAHEETIALGDKEGKYKDYLRKVKLRIDARWVYPGKAFERGERGVTTIRFSIDGDGSLAANTITGSSGYSLLDECALNVVKAAAPYDPLPRAYNLSRINIIASFHYNLSR